MNDERDKAGRELYSAWIKAQREVRGAIDDCWIAMTWERATETDREIYRRMAERVHAASASKGSTSAEGQR